VFIMQVDLTPGQ